MSSSIPLQIAETIQTASINPAPDPAYDINPSNAASQKPVTISPHAPSSNASHEPDNYDEVNELGDEEDAEDIPYDVIRPLPRRPLPRRPSLLPLPDLRFEQSYLASIAEAETYWRIAYITIRDQVWIPSYLAGLWIIYRY